MAITYTDLANTLQGLEAQFRETITKGAFPPDLCKQLLVPQPKRKDAFLRQFIALDTTTMREASPLPVVIAVGSNYGQGSNALIGLKSINGTPGLPAIEEGLGNYRSHLEGLLNPIRKGHVTSAHAACKSGFAKEVWKTGEGINIYTNANAREDNFYVRGTGSSGGIRNLPSAENYHFVMTNFCPFITEFEWCNGHTKPKYPLLEMLLDYGLWLNHIRVLQKALGKHVVLWVGHGNYDVYYRFFNYLVRGQSARFYRLANWLFTSNLSQPPKGRNSRAGFSVCP